MAENQMFRNVNGSNANNAGTNRREDPSAVPAPESGMPAAPGIESVPVPPIAPEGGPPAFPDFETLPPFPENEGPPPRPFPEGPPPRPFPQGPPPRPFPQGPPPRPFPLIPSLPTIPSIPSPQYYGQVRFLNASTNSPAVNIMVDNTTYATNSRFGTITGYDWIDDGFHTITVRRANGFRNVVLQQTFPFTAGVNVTMVLVDTPAGGVNMVKVIDTGCYNMPFNTGCYRMANMSYRGSSFDLMLYGDETVFRNVSFQEVTSYKQAMAGTYDFYVTNSAGRFTVIRELPVIVIGAYPNREPVNEPLLSIQVDIAPGRNYTTYLIGNNRSSNFLRALTVED